MASVSPLKGGLHAEREPHQKLGSISPALTGAVHVQSRARGHVLGPVVASRAVCRRRTGRPIGSLTWCCSGGPSRGPPVHHEIGAATLTTTWSVKRASVCLPIAPTAKCCHRCARVWGFRVHHRVTPVPHHEPGRSRERHPHQQEPPDTPHEWRVEELPPEPRHTKLGSISPALTGAKEKPTTRGGPEVGWGTDAVPSRSRGERRNPTHRRGRH